MMRELNKEDLSYAERELNELISWRGNKLEQIFELKDDNLSIEEKSLNQGFIAISKFKDYPNCIAGGTTWIKISKGLLADEKIQEQIEHFYDSRYQEFLELLKEKGEYHSEAPVWIVVEDDELNKKTVYPTIANHKGENCIVLLINE